MSAQPGPSPTCGTTRLSSPSPLSVAARLQRLPFTGYQLGLATILGVCFAVDTVDLTMMSFLLAPVTQDLHLDKAQAGMAGSAVFVGVGLGATLAGMLSDRYGRKPALLAGMAIWGMGSLLTAFAWNLPSFLAFRLLTGLGLGAEFPVVFALIAELMPQDRRARITGWLQAGAAGLGIAFTAAGSVAISTLGAHLGWRIMSVALSAGSTFGLYAWLRLPESPRWYAERGRSQDAERTLARMEGAVAAKLGRPLPPPSPAATSAADAEVRGGLDVLLSGDNGRRTLFAWALWFLVLIAYYGVSVWVGKILVDRGMSLAASIRTGVWITAAGLPAALFTGRAMEMLGRKPVIVCALICVSVAAFAYGKAASFAAVLAAGATMQMFLSAVATSLYAYTPELFPTRLRATGLGSASTVGRIAAVSGPLLIPVLVVHWGYGVAFACCAGCFIAAAALVLFVGPETRRADAAPQFS
jgi:MFS transporter, putative metabolite:H+ symporter